MAESVFTDLGIDVDLITSDPATFQKRCLEEAKRLADIMEGREAPVDKAVRHILESASEPVTPVKEFLDGLDLDNMTNEELGYTFAYLERVKQRIVVTLESRVLEDTALHVKSKRLASHLYKKLRRGFDAFGTYMGMFHKDFDLATIPAKSGNFSDSVSFHLFIFEGEEYAHWAYIATKLGIRQDIKFLQDFLDYVEANPDCGVKVVEG